MSYYVLTVKSYNDGKSDKKTFEIFETEKEAVASANKDFGANVGASTIKSVMAKVFDDAGADACAPMFWKSDVIDMKYYDVIVANYSDGTEKYTKNYSYDTIDEAISTAHSQYGKYVEPANVSTVLSTIINSVGGQPLTLYWQEPEEVEA